MNKSQHPSADCLQCGAPLKDGKCSVQPWHFARLREAESSRKPSADLWPKDLTICPKCKRDTLSSRHELDWFGEIVCLREFSQHPVPAPHTSEFNKKMAEILESVKPTCWNCGVKLDGEHPVPAPETQTQGDNAELVRMAEKLLEWMPICSKGSSGNIRQTNLRAAIEKFKVEHPEPTKGKP